MSSPRLLRAGVSVAHNEREFATCLVWQYADGPSASTKSSPYCVDAGVTATALCRDRSAGRGEPRARQLTRAPRPGRRESAKLAHPQGSDWSARLVCGLYSNDDSRVSGD